MSSASFDSTPSAPRLGPVQLGRVPRIAAIAARTLAPSELEFLTDSGVTLLEIRADSFPGGPAEALEFAGQLNASPHRTRLGVIGTVRETEALARNRLSIFEKLAPLCDCLDAEYEADEREEIAAIARRAGCRLMLSTHDFEKTPEATDLDHVIAEGERLAAQLVKIAVFARSTDDLARLLEYTRSRAPHPLITIAMSEAGLLSRIAAPFFGSLITYGFLDAPNAPGQLSAQRLHELLLLFHPEYRSDFESRAR
jgi:3-dehydroquinate dehydratase I